MNLLCFEIMQIDFQYHQLINHFIHIDVYMLFEITFYKLWKVSLIIMDFIHLNWIPKKLILLIHQVQSFFIGIIVNLELNKSYKY